MIEEKIKRLKEIQESIDFLEKEKEEVRKDILDYLNKEEIRQYKNDIATVSFTERKVIKTNRDKEDIIAELLAKGLTNLVDLKEKEVIDEHYELNKDYERVVKENHLILKGVEVVTTEIPMIKFL